MEANFVINPDDKFYPDNPVHKYSIFLGKFTDSKGKNYDLAIYDTSKFTSADRIGLRYREDWCDATAHSNEPGDYSSGELNYIYMIGETREWKLEVWRRAKLLNIITVINHE